MSRKLVGRSARLCFFAGLAAFDLLPAQAAPGSGTWQVEVESRADTADKGKITYRLTAQQALTQPDTKPTLTTSTESLTYPAAGGAPARRTVIKYLSSFATFRAPDLTCDGATLRLLPPSSTQDIAAAPAIAFRKDFRGKGFLLQVKVPRGYHCIPESVRTSRVAGLLPTAKPRVFARPPQIAALQDAQNPRLLSVLLPPPVPRAPGTGYEAPYGIEFALVPDAK